MVGHKVPFCLIMLIITIYILYTHYHLTNISYRSSMSGTILAILYVIILVLFIIINYLISITSHSAPLMIVMSFKYYVTVAHSL